MSTSPSGVLPSGSQAVPHARLSDEGSSPRIVSASGGLVFEPFGVPQIPQSLLDWVARAAGCFWFQQQRCLAAVLMVHTTQHTWSIFFPTQRCAKDSACWSAARSNFPGFPADHVVAGSFQTRLLCPKDDPQDSVPPVDGLHIVAAVEAKDQPLLIHPFLRCGERTRRIDPHDLLLDDWDDALEQAMPRLTLV